MASSYSMEARSLSASTPCPFSSIIELLATVEEQLERLIGAHVRQVAGRAPNSAPCHEGRVQCGLACVVVAQLPLVLLYRPPAGSVAQFLPIAAIVIAREDDS